MGLEMRLSHIIWLFPIDLNQKGLQVRPVDVQGSRESQGHIPEEKKTAMSTPGGRSGLTIYPGAIFLGKKSTLSTPVGRSGLSRKLRGQLPGNENLERYFHAALHLVCMVLEGELSICLVAAKQPSNTVTNPRQERLAVDT